MTDKCADLLERVEAIAPDLAAQAEADEEQFWNSKLIR